MFKRADKSKKSEKAAKPAKTRELIPTIVTPDVHMLGNMVSEGSIDLSGTIDGNIRCDVFTLREQGTVKGEITANTVHIQGTVKGLIKAKNVHLHATCKVEGIIIHEQLSIEDGAFVDGKFKRSDRVTPSEQAMGGSTTTEGDDSGSFDDSSSGTASLTRSSNVKVLENIRLIR